MMTGIALPLKLARLRREAAAKGKGATPPKAQATTTPERPVDPTLLAMAEAEIERQAKARAEQEAAEANQAAALATIASATKRTL